MSAARTRYEGSWLDATVIKRADALFSSAYFSSVIVDDSRTYGTIGVVFTFLTWFILIGSVIVLGAAGGAVWQARAGQPAPRDEPETSA